MRIGLTGLHGCGKTTISNLFEEKGFQKVKNPFTFSSEKARWIAYDSDYDDVKQAMIFLEDRFKCFLELDQQTDYVLDRWWLDVCINVKQELFIDFAYLYTTPLFTEDFVGIYLDVDPQIAKSREEHIDERITISEKERYDNAIQVLQQKRLDEKFSFHIVNVDNKTPNEIYNEIILMTKIN